jgi:hypothetical protein
MIIQGVFCLGISDMYFYQVNSLLINSFSFSLSPYYSTAFSALHYIIFKIIYSYYPSTCVLSPFTMLSEGNLRNSILKQLERAPNM